MVKIKIKNNYKRSSLTGTIILTLSRDNSYSHKARYRNQSYLKVHPLSAVSYKDS